MKLLSSEVELLEYLNCLANPLPLKATIKLNETVKNNYFGPLKINQRHLSN